MQKKALLPYLILILLAISGCENENPKNEDSPELSTNKLSKTKIDYLSMDQLSKDKQFDEISNIFNLDETFATAKNAVTKDESLEENSFAVDFSSGNKFESKSNVSYTFLIKNDEENRKHFENLVVEKHIDGTVSGFIVYYEYSQRYLDSLKKGIVIPFDGTLTRTMNKKSLKELKDLFKEVKTVKSSITAKSTSMVCIETSYITPSLCPYGGYHSNGEYCPHISGYWYGYYLQTAISCSDGNTWGWIADTYTYTSSVPDPNVTSGGGSYSTTATVEPSFFSSVEDAQSFINYYGLTGNEIEWARYIPNQSRVSNFMEENGYNVNNKGFVKEAANASVNGGIADFGYIIINKLSGRAKCIYEKLKNTNSGFNSAIKKFDGEFPVTHLKLTINNGIGSNVYGQTIPPVNYVTEIQFNNNSFAILSDLGKATVFAHEIIHAEIFRKMLSAAQQGSLDPITMTKQQQIDYVYSLKNNFPGLFEYFFTRYKSTWNHEMMANHYRGVIADLIEEFDNNRLPRSTYEAVAWIGLGILDQPTNVTTIAWDNLPQSEKDAINVLVQANFFNGPSTCN